MWRVTDHSTLIWPTYFRNYFFPISGDDLGLWQVEIESIYEVNEDQVIRAIRNMSEDPKCPKYPKIGNLTYHIRQIQKTLRETNTIPAEPCEMCHAHTPGYLVEENYPKHHHGQTILRTIVTPCCCALGQKEASQWAKKSDRDYTEVYNFLQTRAHQIRDRRIKKEDGEAA